MNGKGSQNKGGQIKAKGVDDQPDTTQSKNVNGQKEELNNGFEDGFKKGQNNGHFNNGGDLSIKIQVSPNLIVGDETVS